MWSVIIILILVGLALLVLEILVVPGTGVAGIIGFAVMAAGIWSDKVCKPDTSPWWLHLGLTLSD